MEVAAASSMQAEKKAVAETSQEEEVTGFGV